MQRMNHSNLWPAPPPFKVCLTFAIMNKHNIITAKDLPIWKRSCCSSRSP